MSRFNHRKYLPFQPIQKDDRRWPNHTIKRAPRWVSVDLRDGNQALIEPMTAPQKLALWELLLRLGFKEIEVGFPSASGLDYDFLRDLIDNDRIPEDVTIQVLVQAREDLIEKTFSALEGVHRAIVHVYNSTSTVQREQVFGLGREGIIKIAENGARWLQQYADKHPETEWIFQYSPESYTGTELDFAVQVCDAVTNVWQPTPEKPVIINLPATVEMSTPNVYADQVEWFCDHVKNRESLVISLHTHNDRGCAVAAAELGVMAGADRVEGTLLGNGERTGNMDIITMAMNLYSQGVDPELNLANMDDIIQVTKECTQLPLHPRHPYAGELVFTAFSGSHQDAIKKCLARRKDDEPWQVAYLPIDPADIGRSYQEVIRINSQSGKGGMAYVLEREYGLELPRWLQIDFSSVVQAYAEEHKTEVGGVELYRLFEQHYLVREQGMTLERFSVERAGAENVIVSAVIDDGVQSRTINGKGGGVVSAFVAAMQPLSREKIVLVEYSEHALSHSVDADAVCYIQLNLGGERYCGVGRSHDIVQASLSAILGAMNAAALENTQAA